MVIDLPMNLKLNQFPKNTAKVKIDVIFNQLLIEPVVDKFDIKAHRLGSNLHACTVARCIL